MSKIKYFFYGIGTFIVGLIIVVFISGNFSQPTGTQLNTGVFNCGVIAIVTSIIFLSATITMCTFFVVNAINKHYNK